MIAAAGGQSYTFPQRQQRPMAVQQAAPQQQEQSPWDIPMPKDELANVEDLTSNYYNAYGTLKDFTTTMWKDYGVDVTKPDFAQPGGGDLHQAFMQMDAELRMAANDLSEHRKRTEEMAKMEAQGKLVRGTYVDPTTGQTVAYDPTKMLERQFVTPEGQKVSPYVATGLEDAALKAIERGSQTYYSAPDAQAANEEIANVIEMYDKKMKADPYNREYYQRQKDAIMLATKRTPASVFSPTARAKAGEIQTSLDMAKKVVKDSTAYGWTPDRVKYRYVDGKVVPTITPEENTSHGTIEITKEEPSGKKVTNVISQVVDFYYADPATGEVKARYKGDLADPKYDQRTDNKLASELILQFFEGNKDYGKAATAAEALKAYEQNISGGVPVENFLSTEDVQAGQTLKLQAQQTANQIESKVQAEKERLKQEFNKAGERFRGEFTIPIKGKEVKFTGKVIGNLIDLGEETTGGSKIYKDVTGRNIPRGMKTGSLNFDEFIKLIEDMGYFDEYIQKATPVAGGTTPPTAGTKKEIKASMIPEMAKRAGRTVEDYTAILKQKGVTIQENQ